MERFLDYFNPTRYQLDLHFDRQQEIITGVATITGTVLAKVVKFHATGFNITDVNQPFTYDGETLALELGDQTKLNTEATFTIHFTTPLNHNMQACYVSTYDYHGSPQKLIATQFESHYAREAFPCIDEPAAKAIFELALTVDDLQPEDVVLANTPCQKQSGNQFIFEDTPRMSTYLLAWVIGPLHSVSTVNQNGVKVTTYGALNHPEEALTFANDTAARALEYYDNKFQEKYPLPKLDQVALPDFEAGAMENWGLVTYRESMMLADKTATLGTKQSIALTVTHELSHQWFGDLVTMEWWDDLWLNESFASVIEFYATDALYPEFNIWQDFFTSDCLAALKRDCMPGVQSVKQAVHHPSEIATLFDGAIVYAKGAHLIFMLIRLMGEEKFDQGIRAYFDKHKYQNTVGDDLWQALQPFADFNVKDFMHAWISQPGYPMLQRDDGKWQQQRFLITGETDTTKWPLPEIKDDMSGHYLINLDDAEFQTKLSQFDQLSLEQKLRLLIDRELLAKTPAAPSSSLLDLLPKFVGDSSAAVWGILSAIIGDIKLFCAPETESANNYKTYLRELLGSEFAQLNYGALGDVDALTRRDLIIGLAYYAEDQNVLQNLVGFYQDDLGQIDPELRSGVMTAKLHYDEAQVFDAWLQRYQAESDPEIKSDILYSLACFAKQPNHLKRLLDLLGQPEIVRPQDHIYLYIYLLRNHRTREQALDWVIKHWGDVKHLTGDKSIEDYPRYAAGLIRTPSEAQKFYDFFDKMSDDPVLNRTIKIAHTDIDARLRLIAEDSASVHTRLKELANATI